MLTIPDELEPETQKLVISFATALAEKLMRSQMKYDRGVSWMSPHWMDECRDELMKHIEKGDPLDVAAYAAFLWYHGQPTSVK